MHKCILTMGSTIFLYMWIRAHCHFWRLRIVHLLLSLFAMIAVFNWEALISSLHSNTCTLRSVPFVLDSCRAISVCSRQPPKIRHSLQELCNSHMVSPSAWQFEWIDNEVRRLCMACFKLLRAYLSSTTQDAGPFYHHNQFSACNVISNSERLYLQDQSAGMHSCWL